MTTQSASRLEGEYLSSDSDTKAIRPSSPRSVNRVNRHSRTHSSARSRSRSPYRAPRGEKRPREDDHKPSRHDTRTFKVRYEDEKTSRHNSHDNHKSKRSRTYSPSRSRSRSRSPFRHNKEPESPPPQDSQKTQSVSAQNQKSDGVPQLEINAKPMEQTKDRSAAESVKQRCAALHIRSSLTKFCLALVLIPVSP